MPIPRLAYCLVVSLFVSWQPAVHAQTAEPLDVWQVLGQATAEQTTAEQTSMGQALRIGVDEASAAQRFLGRDANQRMVLERERAGLDADWWMVPVEAGYIRLQTQRAGKVFAVAAANQQQVLLSEASADAGQLWRVLPGPANHQFILANARYPGHCLTYLDRSGLVLQPPRMAAGQLWVAFPPARPGLLPPFWRTVSIDVQPATQLAPAELELVNSQRNALWVLLADARQPRQFKKLRIEPHGSLTLTLDRDAGATLIETVEIQSARGLWHRQQWTTSIPAAALYDLSVYENHLQSIAIDRTGKSPNPIEDVNYAPKSIGWFALPAGSQLPQRSRLDVFEVAQAQRNAGAVRRLDPTDAESSTSDDPLEGLLKEFQSVPRRRF